jgi:hypothetical protein
VRRLDVLIDCNRTRKPFSRFIKQLVLRARVVGVTLWFV